MDQMQISTHLKKNYKK